MCGRLTRWLRMIGVDAAYLREADDEQLLDLARSEGRVLVTRDEGLHERAVRGGVRAILLKSGSLTEQLAHVVRELGCELTVVSDRSRCPSCNSSLMRASREEVEGLIPEGSLKRHDEFWRCVKCGKVYWRGRHFLDIERTLSEARELAFNLKGGPK
jgi:uncharacterized protein with PIN domain